MTTKTLLNRYLWLLDEFASNGPSERLLVVRRCQNLTMRFYRARQQYEAMKRSQPKLRIEFFECDKPITKRDGANLDMASQVNREITGLLRAWRKCMQIRRRDRNVAREGN